MVRPRTDPYPEAERDEMIMRLVVMGVDEAEADLYYPVAGELRETAEDTVITSGRVKEKAVTPTPPVDLDVLSTALWRVSIRALVRRHVPVAFQAQWVADFNLGTGATDTKRQVLAFAIIWLWANIP